MMCKKEFKGMNGKKSERNYDIYVMGADINDYIVTVPTSIRFQINNYLTKKRINKELMLMRRIIHTYRYQ